ncbi:MAG: hypothetical protein M3033_15225 [Acidobacteriota bacterium]|nr:hypothetical protein [Acidobacteriota bacterium]
MIIPLDNEILEKWFLDYFPSVPCAKNTISTIGSNPLTEDDFDYVLRVAGLEVYNIGIDTDVLIIGRDDWQEHDEKLNKLLDDREGKSLKVYLQEMFWAYWITGQDPFDDEDVALAFAEEHPALQYFLSMPQIDWVNTLVSQNYNGGNLEIKSPEIGVLKHLGYTVGKTKGLHFSERQKILAKVFNSHLYQILSEEYVRYCKANYPQYLEEWGTPKSEKRLIKMRDFLARFCKNQKRQGNDEAALDYEDDLEWLRMKFHKR